VSAAQPQYKLLVHDMGARNLDIVVAGTRRFEIEREDSRAKALARLKALRRPLPKGFRFCRDEANER
jgi:antitoxin MazE